MKRRRLLQAGLGLQALPVVGFAQFRRLPHVAANDEFHFDPTRIHKIVLLVVDAESKDVVASREAVIGPQGITIDGLPEGTFYIRMGAPQ